VKPILPQKIAKNAKDEDFAAVFVFAFFALFCGKNCNCVF